MFGLNKFSSSVDRTVESETIIFPAWTFKIGLKNFIVFSVAPRFFSIIENAFSASFRRFSSVCSRSSKTSTNFSGFHFPSISAIE